MALMVDDKWASVTSDFLNAGVPLFDVEDDSTRLLELTENFDFIGGRG